MGTKIHADALLQNAWVTVENFSGLITSAAPKTFTGLTPGVFYRLVYNMFTSPGSGTNLFMRINGDSGANYYYAVHVHDTAGNNLNSNTLSATEMLLSTTGTDQILGQAQFATNGGNGKKVAMMFQSSGYTPTSMLRNDNGACGYSGAAFLSSIVVAPGSSGTVVLSLQKLA